MEGLIPMVYKAIKKNRVRAQYRCLSTGVAQAYNIDDFYSFNDHRNDRDRVSDIYTSQMETRGRHRRFASTGDYNGGYGLKYDDGYGENGSSVGRFASPPNKQLKRFRSHRMFSCITGAP